MGQDLSKWDVSHVTDMEQMFDRAKSFNQDLSRWDVSRVTDMDHIFFKATSFNQTLRGKVWVTKYKIFSQSFGFISATSTCRSGAGVCVYVCVAAQ